MKWIPGVEVDALVHEAVFYRIETDDVPAYSTNDVHANAVVMRMQSLGWSYSMRQRSNAFGRPLFQTAFTRDTPPGRGEFESEKRPLPICVAALKAARPLAAEWGEF